MRSVLTVLAAALIVAAAAPAGAQSVCLGADTLGAPMLDQIRYVAASADAKMVTYRQRMQLPQTPEAQVQFVTDTRVCTRARDAYTAAIQRTDSVVPSGRVHVVKVGNVYVVSDPVQVMGEFPIRMTLSNNYKILAKY